MAPEYPYPWLHPSKEFIRNGQELAPDKRFMPQQLLYDLAGKYPNNRDGGFDMPSLVTAYTDHTKQNMGETFKRTIRGNSGDKFHCSLSPSEIAFREASGLR